MQIVRSVVRISVTTRFHFNSEFFKFMYFCFYNHDSMQYLLFHSRKAIVVRFPVLMATFSELETVQINPIIINGKSVVRPLGQCLSLSTERCSIENAPAHEHVICILNKKQKITEHTSGKHLNEYKNIKYRYDFLKTLMISRWGLDLTDVSRVHVIKGLTGMTECILTGDPNV